MNEQTNKQTNDDRQLTIDKQMTNKGQTGTATNTTMEDVLNIIDIIVASNSTP